MGCFFVYFSLLLALIVKMKKQASFIQWLLSLAYTVWQRLPGPLGLKTAQSHNHCQTVRLSDSQAVRLSDCQTVRLSDCQTVRLSDCQTVRLSDCPVTQSLSDSTPGKEGLSGEEIKVFRFWSPKSSLYHWHSRTLVIYPNNQPAIFKGEM